jgi:glutathione peroxidase
MTAPIYDFEAESISGKTVKLSEYEGKPMLIVNTASKCGLTPQYEGLEKLYEEYKDQGLVVLGFPCNQFAGQCFPKLMSMVEKHTRFFNT